MFIASASDQKTRCPDERGGQRQKEEEKETDGGEGGRGGITLKWINLALSVSLFLLILVNLKLPFHHLHSGLCDTCSKSL